MVSEVPVLGHAKKSRSLPYFCSSLLLESICKALNPISDRRCSVLLAVGLLNVRGCGVSSTPERCKLERPASHELEGFTVSQLLPPKPGGSSIHGCREPNGPASQGPCGTLVSLDGIGVFGSSTHPPGGPAS